MALPTVVQSAVSSGLLQSSLAATFPGHVQAGRWLVAVICGVRALGAPTFNVADDQGNSWSEAVTLTMDVGIRRLSLHTARQPAAGKATITVTPSASSDLSLVILELSSVDPVSAVAGSVTASGTGVTPSGALTPLTAEGLVLGAFTHLGVSMALDSGSGFSPVREVENPASGPALHVEARTISTPSVLTVDGTLGISATWGLLAVGVRQWNTYFSVG